MHAGESRLGTILRDIFPTVDIVRRARKVARAISLTSGRYLEVDFFIDQYNLAFEYQEEYHYIPSFWYTGTLNDVQHNDRAKQVSLKALGITLVKVPFWWDGTSGSLLATIFRVRPDLENMLNVDFDYNNAKYRKVLPIPACPPIPWNTHNNESDAKIPYIGRLMYSSLLKPANVISMFSDNSARGWWMSEKYDGFRVCWIRSLQKLFSHTGAVITPVLQIYYHLLCKIEADFDGQLWFGRGTFAEAQRAVYTSYVNNLYWCFLRFLLYECPSHSTKEITYEDRCTILMQSCFGVPFTEVVPQMKFTSKAQHMELFLYDHILAHKGAGIVFKLSESSYVHGSRDPCLSLQIKARRTMSGIVVATIPPRRGELKTVWQLFDLMAGSEVNVALENIHNITLPTVGDIIDIAMNPHAYSDPISADLLNVQSCFADTKPYARNILLSILNGVSQSGFKALLNYLRQRETTDISNGMRNRPYGYWTEEGGKNMRAFFDQFASCYRLGDPLNPTTWYFANTLTLKHEAPFVRYHYGGSIVTALMDIYPDIGLDRDILIGNYWSFRENRKALFDSLANKQGFSPAGLDHKWHSVSRDSVLASVGGAEVLDMYGGSMIMALSDVYPSLKLSEKDFGTTRNYWHRNVRKFVT